MNVWDNIPVRKNLVSQSYNVERYEPYNDGAVLLGLPKAARNKLSWSDLQLGNEIGRGFESVVYDTGLSNRFVLKVEKAIPNSGRDWVKKALDLVENAGDNAARTYYVGKIDDRRILVQERIKPFVNEASFLDAIKSAGFKYVRVIGVAENSTKHWCWCDAAFRNAGIGIDNKLKIIDGYIR